MTYTRTRASNSTHSSWHGVLHPIPRDESLLLEREEGGQFDKFSKRYDLVSSLAVDVLGRVKVLLGRGQGHKVGKVHRDGEVVPKKEKSPPTF